MHESKRFTAAPSVNGGWRVLDTVNGDRWEFGDDRLGALDHRDRQNRAQARAERYAFIG